MKETCRETASQVFTLEQKMLEREASLLLMAAKASAVNLTKSVSFHFACDCKEFLPGNYLINLREVGKYRRIHEAKFVDCILNFY